MTLVFRFFLIVGAGALLIGATTMAIAPRLWQIANAHEETPVRLADFADLSQRSYVYDVRGNEIAAYEIENSQPVAIEDVPAHVIEAFLAIEDHEFWLHHGVNARGLIRAVMSNFSTDSPQQGASTITMQVVKNDYLAGLERDGRYKVLQITYAVRLEKQRTKNEILERYLNTVFFGQNSYGISAAAETYFGKPVTELTFVESAFLAGLVQAPSSYDPIINPERSRVRFTQVLDRLQSIELLTQIERDEIEATFVIPERVQRRVERATERTYFTETLRDYLLNRSDILGATYEERYTRLYRGGLSIHTTLDPFLQARAEAARDVLPDNTLGIDAALTSIETATGAVRVIVGGKGFEPGQNEVNLALAPSQTGSSIKLFILAAALQAGAVPDDIIDGTHPCLLPNVGNLEEPFFEIKGGVNGGIDTLRRHTTRSINCAFARLSQIVGLNRTVDTVYRMAESPYLFRGQSAQERLPIEPHAAFATGANEMSTLDMASGIQTIANEGVHLEPYFVESIDNSLGERVYTHIGIGTQVLDRQTALTAIDIMKGVLTSGTASRALSDFASRWAAFGKTGTQQKNWTAFFVGATPYLSTAVMVRDPDRYTAMTNIPEFVAAGVDRVQGGTFPARIWGAFMEGVGLDKAELDWDRPDSAGRFPARLYLPGVECVFEVIGFDTTNLTIPPNATAPESTTVTGTTVAPVATAPSTTVALVPILGLVEGGTTIPPDVLDPRAPLPSVPILEAVYPCGSVVDGIYVPPTALP